MKPTTLTFDRDRIDRLHVLIVAAGKSPATDGNMMMAAAEMVDWIGRQVQAASAHPELNLVNSKAA